MNYITDEAGTAYSRFYPFPTSDITISTNVVAVSGEAIDFKVGAAGFKGILTLDKNKVTNVNGDKIGSHWREQQNLLFENAPNIARVSAIVETAGSATISIKIDTNNNAPNLEQLFEISSGNSQYVLLTIDPSGNELYGFIRGVSVSGSVYTITVNSTLAGGTQDWVGSTANFNGTDATKLAFKIFSYESSILFTTGTIITTEKPYDPSKTDLQILNEVLTTNGDYAVDYYRGRIFYRKATTGTSDTVAYNTRAQTSVASVGTVDTELPAAAALADATANPTTTSVGAHMEGYNGTTWDRIRTGSKTVATTLTGFVNIIPFATFNTSPTTRTNGQGGPLEADSNGNLLVSLATAISGEDTTNNLIGIQNKPVAVSTYAWSVDQSASLEASSIVKASPGTLRKIEGRIDSTAPTGTYYIQTLNHAALPPDGAVTFLLAPKKIQHTTGTDSNYVIDCEDNCIFASTGIVQCLSSTQFTKTISGAYLSTNAYYK